MTEERVDNVLRRALSPTPAEAARVAEGALRQDGRVVRRKGLAFALGAALTVAGLFTLVVVRPHLGPPAPVTAVYSVNDLVVGVSSTGSIWITGPGTGPDTDQPSMIVMRGESQ